MYKLFLKRFMDIILSFFGIVVLFIPMLLIALTIKLDSKGPVFFKQKRIGLHKKEFNMLKFRSMRTDAPKDMPTHLLNNPELHITRIGRIMRKLSIDELPQMINILKGEMSIIGPRPALYNQYDLIAERDKYGANDIRPGLTGYAQINGRDELPIEIKAKLDGEYTQKLSFTFDAKLFFNTIISVLKHDGIVEGNTSAAHTNLEDKEVVKYE